MKLLHRKYVVTHCSLTEAESVWKVKLCYARTLGSKHDNVLSFTALVRKPQEVRAYARNGDHTARESLISAHEADVAPVTQIRPSYE